MPLDDLWKEADRQLSLCNACRYCEGFCAVFPALELRESFDKADILYLSNLCHDCRDCYTACMYAPPHEFAINVPEVLSEVRLRTYEEYASPRAVAGALRKPIRGLLLALVGATAFVAAVAVLLAAPKGFARTDRGPGEYYQIIPYALMWTFFTVVSLYVLGVWAYGALRFWRDTSSPLRPRLGFRSVATAATEALTLRYLRGGGAGCDYPGPDGSYSRLILHQFVAYGFVAAFAATVLAAMYQDIFGIMPPFPVLSAPVLVGAAGGIAMVIGATGLVYLKMRADSVPTAERMAVLDYSFLVLLDVTALTGICLLLLRDTSIMAPILVIHLGSVLGLFLTAPYGKFVHFVYRSLALVQHHLEVGNR